MLEEHRIGDNGIARGHVLCTGAVAAEVERLQHQHLQSINLLYCQTSTRCHMGTKSESNARKRKEGLPYLNNATP